MIIYIIGYFVIGFILASIDYKLKILSYDEKGFKLTMFFWVLILPIVVFNLLVEYYLEFLDKDWKNS